jgi:hypothetical protein
MNDRETPQKVPDELEEFVLGKFDTRQDADIAFNDLIEAGFSQEKIEISTLALKPTITIRESKAVEGAKGGAFAGAGLGIIAGLSINVIVTTFPDQHIPIDIPAILLILGCSTIGAIAVGIVGAIAGGKVPQTEGEHIPFEYAVTILGSQEDYNRARQELLKQGILLKT